MQPNKQNRINSRRATFAARTVKRRITSVCLAVGYFRALRLYFIRFIFYIWGEFLVCVCVLCNVCLMRVSVMEISSVLRTVVLSLSVCVR